MDRDVAAISTLFWNSAMAEFEEGLDKDKDIFTRVEVAVPKSLTADIIKALHRGCDKINLELKNIILRQSVFTDPEKCRFLRSAPVEKIRKMTKKLSQAEAMNAPRSAGRPWSCSNASNRLRADFSVSSKRPLRSRPKPKVSVRISYWKPCSKGS